MQKRRIQPRGSRYRAPAVDELAGRHGSARASLRRRGMRPSLMVGLALIFLSVLGSSVAYYASPFFSTRFVEVQVLDRSFPSMISDEEIESVSASLRDALDKVVPGAPVEAAVSPLGRLGSAIMEQVRGHVLDETSRQLASREGIAVALYGRQVIAARRVAIRRGYTDFPDVFSVNLDDEADKTPVVEIVYERSGFASWHLAAIRPHWLRTEGEVLLRELAAGRAGVGAPQSPTPPRN